MALSQTSAVKIETWAPRIYWEQTVIKGPSATAFLSAFLPQVCQTIWVESFTNLNLAAIKGDDFPYKNHDSQGSVGGLGRDDLFTQKQ